MIPTQLLIRFGTKLSYIIIVWGLSYGLTHSKRSLLSYTTYVELLFFFLNAPFDVKELGDLGS